MGNAYADRDEVIKAKKTDTDHGFRRGDTLRVIRRGPSGGCLYAANLTRPDYGGKSEAFLLDTEYEVIGDKGASPEVSRIYFLGIPIIRIEKVSDNAGA